MNLAPGSETRSFRSSGLPDGDGNRPASGAAPAGLRTTARGPQPAGRAAVWGGRATGGAPVNAANHQPLATLSAAL